MKSQFIKNQHIEIEKLRWIDHIEVAKIVLAINKILVNWENVFHYFGLIEQEAFDDVLIEFLNKESNYSTLSLHKLNTSGRPDEYLKMISKKIIYCKELNIRALEKILESFIHRFNDFEIENLELDKIKVMISKGKLSLSIDNFKKIKSLGDRLQIKLIEINKDEFIEQINSLPLEANDYFEILKSTEISDLIKIELIQKMDYTIITSNSSIAKEVCRTLPADKVIPLRYEVMEVLFDVTNPILKLITLLNLNFDAFDDSQIQSLVEKLGDEYKKIFIKQHKPVFSNTPQHISLFEKLQAKDLIIRFEVIEKKDEIKVIAKY